MRFNNNELDNEITLSRRERKALGAQSRHVSASAIGQLWRGAMADIVARRENAGPAESSLEAVQGFGMVSTHNPAYYELKRLDRRQRCLDAIGHMALAIEAEVLQFPEPPAEDL
jgi:hypothetical protein